MKFINLRASRILFLLLAVSCVCLGASEPTAQGQTCTMTNSAPIFFTAINSRPAPVLPAPSRGACA
jgi:hypothetical protein